MKPIYLLPLLALIGFMSCEKDELLDLFESQEDIPLAQDDDLDILKRVVKIDAERTLLLTNRTSTTQSEYSYDDEGNLLQEKYSYQSNGRLFYEYEYDEEQRLIKKYYKDRFGQGSDYDSLHYDQLGKPIELHRFQDYGGEGLIKRQSLSYTYSQEGRLAEISYWNVLDEEAWFRVEYEWKDGNIQVKREFEDTSDLVLETNYTYDQELNPMRLGLPLVERIETSRNNRLSFQIIDHKGLYDGITGTEYEYSYDSDGLIVSATTSSESIFGPLVGAIRYTYQ